MAKKAPRKRERPENQLEIRAPRRRAYTAETIVTQERLGVRQRIGGNLTPPQLSALFAQADTGGVQGLQALAQEARKKDCHLQSVLQTRELAVSGLPWQVNPFKKGSREYPTARDANIASLIEGWFRKAKGFRKAIKHLAGAAYHGFAVVEVMYGLVDGYIVPVEYRPLMPHRFQFDQLTGDLRWRDTSMSATGVSLADYPGKFIVHMPRVNGDDPNREGLCRPLLWAALFRNWDLRDWLQLAELAWKPSQKAIYEKGASEEDIANLEAIMESFVTTNRIMLPKTTDILLEWPKNPISGGSGHKDLFDTIGAEMSKATLGQTLTTEQGSRGSQSLGNVHDKVRRDIVESDARDIEDTENEHIAFLTAMNFGPNVEPPTLAIQTQDPTDLVAFSTAVEKFAGVGVEMPVRWIRDEAGIPEPKGDEETIGGDDEEEEPVQEPGEMNSPDDSTAAEDATDTPASDATDA